MYHKLEETVSEFRLYFDTTYWLEDTEKWRRTELETLYWLAFLVPKMSCRLLGEQKTHPRSCLAEENKCCSLGKVCYWCSSGTILSERTNCFAGKLPSKYVCLHSQNNTTLSLKQSFLQRMVNAETQTWLTCCEAEIDECSMLSILSLWTLTPPPPHAKAQWTAQKADRI